MKKIINKVKGFTLVELAIVIAVIAILVAVLVPTFIALIDKANESNDMVLVSNLNTSLSIAGEPDKVETDNGTIYNVTTAITSVRGDGYDVSKLSPTADGGDIVYNASTNKFIYYTDDFTDLAYGDEPSSTDVLVVITDSTISRYNYAVSNSSIIQKNAVQYCVYTTDDDVTVSNDASGIIVWLYTESTTATINVPNGTVYHDGECYYASASTADNSYHHLGKINYLSVQKGRYVPKENAEQDEVTYVYVASSDLESGKVTIEGGADINDNSNTVLLSDKESIEISGGSIYTATNIGTTDTASEETVTVDSEFLESNEHLLSDEGEVTTAATCTTTGVMKYTTVFGTKVEVVIPYAEHTCADETTAVTTYKITVSVVNEETVFDVKAIASYACSVCHQNIESESEVDDTTKTQLTSVWTYEEGTTKLTGYTGTGGNISIPEGTTEIVSATTSNLGVFYSKRNLITGVTIPDSVTTIGDYAFYSCSGLTSLTIPASVTSFGSNAFKSVSDSLNVYYSGSASQWATISFADLASNPLNNYGCLYIDNALATEIDLSGISAVNAYSFAKCSSLKTVVISDATTIGERAFYYSPNIESVTLKDVETIGEYAFYNCSALESITLSDSLITIGASALMNSGISSITIPESVTTIEGSAFRNCDNLTSITIPGKVTSIGSYILWGCDSLETAILCEGLTTVADTMFYQCGSLKSVTIPNTVTEISSSAFNGCSSLESVTIPDRVTYIGGQTFEGCSSLTSIKIPDSVTGLGIWVFYGCSSLQKVEIGSGLTAISEMMFANCTSLESIVIPDTITSIGERAFYGCTSLANITMSANIEEISDTDKFQRAFENTAYYNNESNWVDDVLYLDSYLIAAKDTVKGIYTVKDDTTLIANGVFNGNTSIISVIIPSSMKYIGTYAFYNCLNLIEVGDNSSSLTLTLQETSNGSIAYYAKNVYTSGETSNLITQGDYMFYNDSGSYYLVSYNGNETSITLPTLIIDGTKASYGINSYAFYYNSLLKSITMPESANVTSIGEKAFYCCTGLTSIIIPSTITCIGNQAFYYCYNLIEVCNDSSLEITAGNSSNGYVGYYAENVYTSTNGESILIIDGDFIFYKGAKSSGYIYYLVGYKGSDTNITLPDIELGEDDVYWVKTYAFYNNTAVTSVMISDTVTRVDSYAFYGCTSLTSVVIGSGVTIVSKYAFSGCTSLETVVFKGGDTKLNVSKAAFFECSALESVYYNWTSSETSKKISITPTSNKTLTDATKYYYAENDGSTTTAGNYWYYDTNGEIVTWNNPDSE